MQRAALHKGTAFLFISKYDGVVKNNIRIQAFYKSASVLLFNLLLTNIEFAGN
jgi:hypothetical protein